MKATVSEELRDAAQRILDDEQSDDFDYELDVASLAQAYLSEHLVDDAVAVDEAWIRSVLPTTTSHGRRAEHIGQRGRFSWSRGQGDFTTWINGELLEWQQLTRRDIRQFCGFAQIQLKE